MRLTPYALGGLIGLREELPHFAESRAWARALAVELADRGLRPHPAEPHISTFEVYVEGSADDVNERLLAVMERERVMVCFPFRDGDMPGTAVTEIAAYRSATAFEPSQVADWLVEVAGS